MTIYLIRHATPDRTTNIPYHVPPGPPLTMNGELETVSVAHRLAPANITRIYFSPMRRARQTADIIAHALNVPSELKLELIEWTGRDTEDSMRVRLQPVLSAAFNESERRGSIAFVTHGWVIRTLLSLAGIDEAELTYYCGLFDTDNPLPCAGIWKVARNEKPEFVYAPTPVEWYRQKVTA